MASRIKERGLRVGALAHPYRTPSLSLYVNTDADRRSQPYICPAYKTLRGDAGGPRAGDKTPEGGGGAFGGA